MIDGASQLRQDAHEDVFDKINFARVNAFTQDAFGGNPAAVCLLPYFPPDEWLQQVAVEFDLPEIAYLVRRQQPSSEAASESDTSDSEFDLRWFTPATEVSLCGHATLASALFLFSAGLVGSSSVSFQTKSGRLSARLVPPKDSPLARLQPSPSPPPPPAGPSRPPHGSAEPLVTSEAAASAPSGQTGTSGGPEKTESAGSSGQRQPPQPPASPSRSIVEIRLPAAELRELPREEGRRAEAALRLPEGAVEGVFECGGTEDWLVQLPSHRDVLRVEPAMPLVDALPCRGLIVTAAVRPQDGGQPAGPAGSRHGEEGGESARHGWARLPDGVDLVCRFFGCGPPDEDPVTGSAFCALLPYWAPRFNRTSLLGFQASSRGGIVAAELNEDAGTVTLQGWGVVTMVGVLMNAAPKV